MLMLMMMMEEEEEETHQPNSFSQSKCVREQDQTNLESDDIDGCNESDNERACQLKKYQYLMMFLNNVLKLLMMSHKKGKYLIS